MQCECESEEKNRVLVIAPALFFVDYTIKISNLELVRDLIEGVEFLSKSE